jgi:hypothetical protein
MELHLTMWFRFFFPTHTNFGLLLGKKTNVQNCQKAENIRYIRLIRVGLPIVALVPLRKLAETFT